MNESIVVDIILWVVDLLFYLVMVIWVIHDNRP